MPFVHFLTLYMIQQLKGERTSSAIFHLLKGKKSAQTIQDSRFFKLDAFFQTLTSIKMKDIQLWVNELVNLKFIEEIQPNQFIITDLGTEQLNKYALSYHIPHELNGHRYSDVAKTFWPKLVLIVQSLSFLVAGKPFVPITNDATVLASVKAFIKKKNKQQLTSAIYHELESLFDQLHEPMADLLALRLTGSERIGLSINQIAEYLKLDPVYCFVLMEAGIHHLIDQVNATPQHYPLLNGLIDQDMNKRGLTQSTEKTYLMLNRGLSLEEIVKVRRLRPSTIEDHLVEITLHHPEFDITPYVPVVVYSQILEKVNSLKTHRLKAIKDQLEEGITYLQIRLVLAKEVGRK